MKDRRIEEKQFKKAVKKKKKNNSLTIAKR